MDPDPGGLKNVDPDPDSDPQHCLKPCRVGSAGIGVIGVCEFILKYSVGDPHFFDFPACVKLGVESGSGSESRSASKWKVGPGWTSI
jgi:hypothetical protein